MLETESTRQNIEPDITSKTDSVFYGFGILEAMQQLADQYVFQGELRGDLVKLTTYTDNNLRQLYDYTATTANKYDSAYVYYRVINNCNYYIAHRDTSLLIGSRNVVMQEYAAVKAIRAWAYLQLGRNYKTVPFFTEPLTEISQIDNGNFPELDIDGLVARLAPDLEQYTGYTVPTYGQTIASGINIGSPNWESTAKLFNPIYCFIPVDVILGDLYLEAGNYDQAASHYVTYLTRVAPDARVVNSFTAQMRSKYISMGRFSMFDDTSTPDLSLMRVLVEYGDWSNIFGRNRLDDLISMIPMAVNRQSGPVTDVPLTFGFNYYATNEELSANGNTNPYVDEIQLLPSSVLNTLSDSTEYYYYYDYSNVKTQNNNYDSIQFAKCGDMRLRNIIHQTLVDDSTHQWIDKYKYANIILYRTSTVLLHLAEAFNRLGMPDAAFAILKDGISDVYLQTESDGSYTVRYLTDATRQALINRYPLLSDDNKARFAAGKVMGIHVHGAGAAASDQPITGAYLPGTSPYQLDRMVGLKLAEIQNQFGVTPGATKLDSINAVEDILCDEYALELAFEGNRFADLCRLARHKNGHAASTSQYDGSPASYGSNFGYKWIARKLAFKNAARVSETTEDWWYLPFK